MPPEEVFLSHSERDRGFVVQLAAELERHGIRYWYSRSHILAAQNWHDEIGKALERCDWFLLVLSPEAVKSKWVKRELLYALDQDRYEGRILSILHQPCAHRDLSWSLGPFQSVDCCAQGFDHACRQLLRVWGIGYISR